MRQHSKTYAGYVGIKQSDCVELKRMNRIQTRHLAAAVILEVARPRSWPEWIEIAVKTLGIVPCLSLPLGAVGACVALLKRNYVEFGMAIASMVCLPGTVRLLIKIVRRVKTLMRGFRTGVKLAVRAQKLAQQPAPFFFRL